MAPPAIRTEEQITEADAELGALVARRKELEESLKQEYGKKQEHWPPEKPAEFEGVARTVARLAFEKQHRNYCGAKPEEVQGLPYWLVDVEHPSGMFGGVITRCWRQRHPVRGISEIAGSNSTLLKS